MSNCNLKVSCTSPSICNLDTLLCESKEREHKGDVIETMINKHKYMGHRKTIVSLVSKEFENKFDVKCTSGMDMITMTDYNDSFLSVIEVKDEENDDKELAAFIDINNGHVFCMNREQLFQTWSNENKHMKGFIVSDKDNEDTIRTKKNKALTSGLFQYFLSIPIWNKFITLKDTQTIMDSGNYIFMLLVTQYKWIDINPRAVSSYHNEQNGGDPLYMVIPVGTTRDQQIFNTTDKEDISSLTYASASGDLDIAMHLVEGSGIDVNGLDHDGESPLTSASTEGQLDMVIYLINNGANINLQTEDGMTALMHSVKNFGILKYLVENGADVNIQDVDGDNVLAYISKELRGSKFLTALEYLVDNGSDINNQNVRGTTSLMVVSIYQNRGTQALKYLIDKGAEINMQDVDGRTALIWTSELGHFNALKYLVDRGAGLNIQDNKGETALISASRNGHIDILKYLTKKGANLDMQDLDGNTALIWASKYRYSEIVNYLIDKGADANIRNNDGYNALSLLY